MKWMKERTYKYLFQNWINSIIKIDSGYGNLENFNCNQL